MEKSLKVAMLTNQLKMAENSCVPIAKISEKHPELTLEDAYAIQLGNINNELLAGRRITGKKIGLTSHAVQNMLGVDQPDFGHLLDSMEVKGGIVPMNHLIQPRAEGEIAFVLKNDLKGPGVTAEDVLRATDYVSAAIEIVDSRIAKWQIGIIDTVADNASAGMYILSDKKVRPEDIDLKAETMWFQRNGEPINIGQGSVALGDPAYCVAWLANTLAGFGVTLKKGEVILSGALSAMLDAKAGDSFKATFNTLGEVEVCFK